MPSRARKVFAGKGCRYCREKRTVHLEAEEAVDQNGVACHIQKVHGNGEHHHLFQQGVAPQNGAELDIQPLKQYRTAYDAGVKAGTVKGVLRRPQELKDQFRL